MKDKKLVKSWTTGDSAIFEFKRDVLLENYYGSIKLEKNKKYKMIMCGFGDISLGIRIEKQFYHPKYKDIYKITRVKDNTYSIYGDDGECIENNFTTQEYSHPSFYDNGEY